MFRSISRFRPYALGATLTILLCLCLTATTALAKGYEDLDGHSLDGIKNGNYTVFKYTSTSDTSYMNTAVLWDDDIEGDATTYGAKSSKPKIVKITQKSDRLILAFKKAGKSKITYTYGGVKKTLNITVRNYVNPVKTFKIGGKNSIASKFNKTCIVDACKAYKCNSFLPAGKLKVTAKKGWTVKGIHINGSSKTVKSGYKIKKNKVHSVTVECKNKKTNAVEVLVFEAQGS